MTNHCSFVLLAEFHIQEGAQLRYQFPQPLGIDESVLAMSMLPDGAETQLDDWTIFFLNQTSFNTLSPVLALDTPEVTPGLLPGEEDDRLDARRPGMLCVLNLVRTKHDKSLDRGARVLALAICTRHPFIHIFKPFLLMALDDYFADPSQDCLAQLFDAINSMDLSAAPVLTRREKLVMRSSERNNIFLEKFSHLVSHQSWGHAGSRGTKKDLETPLPALPSLTQCSPSDASFSLGGSAVWVGDETALEAASVGSLIGGSTRYRKSSSSSSNAHGGKELAHHPPNQQPFIDPLLRHGVVKDTHFYHTTVPYKDHHLPIRMPLSTFPEEVGDYSLITLIKVFSSHQLLTGPVHPHLHTNGSQTHPIIVLFNALVTGKRIIFLGHKRPAGVVSTFVLSACALGSGCGAVLRGFIERAFPYANLNNRDEWEAVPAYIAGVTNPIFEASRAWDVLLDISTGGVTVARDIHITYPTATVGLGGSLLTRSGSLKAELSIPSEDEFVRMAKEGSKTELGKDHNVDKVFIEDIRAAIEDHFGETLVRLRFTEYVTRFVRLASRYEEEITGHTTLGYPSAPFTEFVGRPPKLGSGITFGDEMNGWKELVAHAPRIEAWRKTNSYHYFVKDFARYKPSNAIKGFDVVHQLFRLRYAKNMPDAEALAIAKTLAEGVKTYDQVVELLASLPHGGALLHLGFLLFHKKEAVRDYTVNLFNQLRAYPVGILFLQALNHLQRYAYVRQAHAKETRSMEHLHQHNISPGS